MKAVLLCAGLGTRLRPLTSCWPKPAIPLLGQPLIRYALASLKRAGVTAVGLNVHHLPERMIATAQAECLRAGVALQIVREEVLQGTGGGIRGFKDFIGDESFIVFNGDILFALDFAEAVKAHHASGVPATMVLLPVRGANRNVEVDSGGAVRRIAGHGPGGPHLSPWHFSGVHVMEPVVFDFMIPSGPEDINWHVYPRMIEAGRRVQGYYPPSSCYWSDLGSPESYLKTSIDLLTGKVEVSAFPNASPFDGAERKNGGWLRGWPSVEGEVEGPFFVDAGQVETAAHVGPNVYLGPKAKVETGAQVTDSIVLEDTVVQSNESLKGSIAFGIHRLKATGGNAPKCS